MVDVNLGGKKPRRCKCCGRIICEHCGEPVGPVPFIVAWSKVHVGRNDPCPCGSGRKFKRCCGLRPSAN